MRPFDGDVDDGGGVHRVTKTEFVGNIVTCPVVDGGHDLVDVEYRLGVGLGFKDTGRFLPPIPWRSS